MDGSVVGVEVGGSVKNVMAVAAGMSDGLGLGDVVAPSLLAGWARRHDVDVGGGGFLVAAMGGFVAGCVALEVAPPELSRAALLFLIPATAAAKQKSDLY